MKMLAEYVENAIKFEKLAAEEKDAKLKDHFKKQGAAETEPTSLDHILQFGLPLAVWGAETSQFYAKAEDEERYLQSSINQRPVMVKGLTTEGRMASFGGIVQSVENGHREYPGYPVRITMK